MKHKGSLRGRCNDPGDRKDRPWGRRLPMMLQLLALFLSPVAICGLSPATGPTDDKNHRALLVDGHQVPAFTTAEEQLRYARSTFDETEEKVAALKAIERIHPADREHAAMAALDLAFLSLGEDYRLADKNQCILARNNYLGVLEKYPDLPAVAAKALWYLGWIACDLEGDRPQGIRWFQRLLTLYPQVKLSNAAAVPWLTIRPADPGWKEHSSYPKAVLTWADIAHLEIIRNTESRDQAWQSFLAIQQAAAGNAFAAAALKVLIGRHGFDAESERLAREYLQNPDGDSVMKNDLFLALSVHRRQAAAPGGPQ